MRIPNIKGAKFNDVVKFFLPDMGSTYSGAWLEEDAFVEAFLLRVGDGAVRCADPRCNLEFNATRDDQRYCDATCSNRHRAREHYRLRNGLPDEEPKVVKTDSRAVEVDLRKHLNAVRADVGRRPAPFKSERLPNGHLRMKSATLRDQAFRATFKDPWMRWSYDLRQRGFVWPNDFWPDQANALFARWTADGEKLLADDAELIKLYVNEEGYSARIEEEKEQQRASDEAAKRHASLFPDMDRIRADGSVGPTAEPSKGEA